MPLAALIPLTCCATLNGKHFLGKEVHAFFLREVEKRNPVLSAKLHTDAEVKPFTCSGLISPRNPSQVYNTIQEGEEYLLRITAIDDALSQVLQEDILPHLPDTIRLSDAEFQVRQPVTQGHPLAGAVSQEDLLDRHSGMKSLKEDIGLEFLSPTAFRGGGRNLVVPLPALVFRSYMRNWNAFCQPKFDMDFLGLLEESVYISRFSLKTILLSFKDHKEIGCLGQCHYAIFQPLPELWRLLHLLADFAFFCGTGHKTTMGMGQTVRPNPRPLPNVGRGAIGWPLPAPGRGRG